MTTREANALIEVIVEAKIHRTAGGAFESSVTAPGAAGDPAVEILVVELGEVADALSRRMSEVTVAGKVREQVPRHRMTSMARALTALSSALLESASDADVSSAEFESRAAGASEIAQVYLTGGTRQLARLASALVEPEVDDPETTEERERRAVLRNQILYRMVRRDSYTVRELSKLGLSRQRLGQLRKEDRLFAIDVPYHKGFVYPRWQFNDVGKPRKEMPRLIGAAREAGLDGITFHSLMTNLDAEDGPPIDLLEEGEIEVVIDIIRAAG